MPQRSNLEGYSPLLLASQVQVNAYWPIIEPMLKRCADATMSGEMTTEDIYQEIIKGRAYAFVAQKMMPDGPDVKLVLVFQICAYPQLSAANIIAVAGSDLNFFADRFWKAINGWAYINGIRAFEAHVSDGMQRVLEKLNFSKVANLVRVPVTGD